MMMTPRLRVLIHEEDTQRKGIGRNGMKMRKNPQKKLWELTSGTTILYQGRRSPWDHPEIIRDALAAERSPKGRAPGEHHAG